MTHPKKKTCIVVIQHNGEYYVSRKPGKNSKFQFMRYEYDVQQEFKMSNIELRKEIAQQIQAKTPFRNTVYTLDKIDWAVSLQRSPFHKHLRYVIFLSNYMADSESNAVYIPYGKNLMGQCDKETEEVLRYIKIRTRTLPFLIYMVYALLLFLTVCIQGNANPQKIDYASFATAVLCLFMRFVPRIVDHITKRPRVKFWLHLFKSSFKNLTTILAFVFVVISLLWDEFLVRFNLPWSELGLVMVFIIAIVDLAQGDL